MNGSKFRTLVSDPWRGNCDYTSDIENDMSTKWTVSVAFAILVDGLILDPLYSLLSVLSIRISPRFSLFTDQPNSFLW